MKHPKTLLGGIGIGVAVSSVVMILVLASLPIAWNSQAEQPLGVKAGLLGYGQMSATNANGQVFWTETHHNIFVATGYTGAVRQLAVGASGAAAAGNGTAFMQLANNATVPNGSETTCAGALSGSGLDPIPGTYAAITNGYNLTHTWTATGAATISRLCIWDGNPSSGALWDIVEWSAAATVAAGDTFGGNFSVTLSAP